MNNLFVSDNGTQFTYHEFNNFCKLHAIKHIYNLLYHSRLNGQVERFVVNIKLTLKNVRNDVVNDEA